MSETIAKIEAKTFRDPVTGCWNWTGAHDRFGHGRISDYGHVTGVHQVAYRHFKGEIEEGMCVCHTCDNPACWNPDHLFKGTKGDNNRDCWDKDRRGKGAKHFMAKLTQEQIERIVTTSQSAISLAQEFGVNRRTIHWWRKRYAMGVANV